jgi:hypothetical protein
MPDVVTLHPKPVAVEVSILTAAHTTTRWATRLTTSSETDKAVAWLLRSNRHPETCIPTHLSRIAALCLCHRCLERPICLLPTCSRTCPCRPLLSTITRPRCRPNINKYNSPFIHCQSKHNLSSPSRKSSPIVRATDFITNLDADLILFVNCAIMIPTSRIAVRVDGEISLRLSMTWTAHLQFLTTPGENPFDKPPLLMSSTQPHQPLLICHQEIMNIFC